MENIKFFKYLKYELRNFTETPLKKLEDQYPLSKLDQKITPIVHQTWVENKFGKTHFNSLMSFRKINPNLTFKIYTEEDMNTYMYNNWSNRLIYKIFSNSLFGPLKTDIFRYCILFDQGGYYFDISRGCKIPLDQLHNKNTTMIISYEDTECYIPPKGNLLFQLKRPFNHFLQWGLAIEKKHSFLKLLIHQIENLYPYFKNKEFENPKLAILNFTGPGAYTIAMRNFINKYGLNGISELDIKFNNKGIFKLQGSQFRYQKFSSYTYEKNKIICK